MTTGTSQQNQIDYEKAILPFFECDIDFRTQRMLLHEMYTSTVQNAPDDEVDNYTAKRFSSFYLAMINVLENIDEISQKSKALSFFLLPYLSADFLIFTLY